MTARPFVIPPPLSSGEHPLPLWLPLPWGAPKPPKPSK